ncbi:MAG: UDP-2,3-diacylglucosamine hydrolase [Anaerophaga sp.]|uniref:metallophosphoesterase n=1 Tax=Anaerophaga thermohalophila TaxID=177400 RepID=UPI000237C47D|nr:metallophosphoesterase [Anaerophaga thermohalophila]MBZ4675551.1 UDP-2,3-diacylglucosamine hydrolase [Anaerophaga sp.]MDN5291448.1 hypothetical protein [Anaerophaga sp.]
MQNIKNVKTRKVKATVIPGMYPGTYACKATRILDYLKGINPEKLVLNGEIVDGWHLSRSYFSVSHLKVLRQLIKM